MERRHSTNQKKDQKYSVRLLVTFFPREIIVAISFRPSIPWFSIQD